MIGACSIICPSSAPTPTPVPRFYDVVLAPLGGTRIMEFGRSLGYGVPPMPDFWIGPHQTGDGSRSRTSRSPRPIARPFKPSSYAAVSGCRGAARARGCGPSTTPLLRRIRPRSRRQQRRGGLSRCGVTSSTTAIDSSGRAADHGVPRQPGPDTSSPASTSPMPRRPEGLPEGSPG